MSVCGVCGADAAQFCGRCRVAAYCGRECQTADWRSHCATCANLPRDLLQVQLKWADDPAKSELCTKASTSNEGDSENFHAHVAGVPLGAYLQTLGAKISVDDALFVQLVAASQGLLSGAGNGDTNTYLFGVGVWAPWLTLKRAKKESVERKPVRFAPKSSAVDGELAAAGQWLAGPDFKNKYMGMTREGPARMTLAQWHTKITDSLAASGDKVARMLLDTGSLDFDQFRLYKGPAGEPEE